MRRRHVVSEGSLAARKWGRQSREEVSQEGGGRLAGDGEAVSKGAV